MNRKTTNSILLFLCVAAIGFFTSCSSDDDNSPQSLSSAQVVNNIKSKLYKDGEVHANKIDNCTETEYVVISVSGGDKTCTFFTEITGVEAPLKDSYEYTYISDDGICKIRIRGTKEAVNGKYATITFDVPNCPELTLLHIGTLAFLNDNNSESAPDDSEGHPVIL